jgi:hypothetical protein
MSRGKQKKPISEAMVRGLERANKARLEIRAEMREETKKEFLERILDFTNMSKVAEAVGIEYRTILRWMQDDAEFKESVQRLKAIRDAMREENEEEFLHLVGIGAIKMGKESGLGMPNVVAAKMGLVARNPKRWSERISMDRTTTRTIKLITVHAGGQDESTIIDATEVKELPSGE